MKLMGLAHTAEIEQSESHDGAVTRLARQLNMAFLVYRGLMSSDLKKQPTTIVGTETAKVLIESGERIRSYWIANFSPNIQAGLQIGGLDDATSAVIAGKYAGKLAEQINEVSDRAFLEGYHAALNKGWDRALAWERISEAYGLDPVQMRKWVSYYPEDGYHPQDIPEKSRSLLDKMLGDRGKRIGDHEAWNIKQTGKQTYWSQQVASGSVPETAKKVWYTARDELVCPVCAPLDGIAIPITSEFDTGSGEFFTPPLHVNCRCEINLQFPDVVTKAMGDDKYNRDKRGRFSAREARERKSVGQWQFVKGDPKWNSQINADVDRVTSESPYENQPKWLYREQSAASHMYSKWLDTPSAPFSESYGDTASTTEVGGYIDWLVGNGEFRLKYPTTQTYESAGVVPLSQIDIDHFSSMSPEEQKQWIRDMAPYEADKRRIASAVIEKTPGWKSPPMPLEGMWDNKPLKKLSSTPSKALSKDEIESMKVWNSPDYEGDWNHGDQTFADYSRPTTVTRGSKSQPQKTATATKRTLVVQKPKEEELPYGLERVISTPDFVKALDEKTALTPVQSVQAVDAATKKRSKPKSKSKGLNATQPPIIAADEMTITPVSAINSNGLTTDGGMLQDGSVVDFDLMQDVSGEIASNDPGEALLIEYDNYDKTEPEYKHLQQTPALLIHPRGAAATEGDFGINPAGAVQASLLLELHKGDKIAEGYERDLRVFQDSTAESEFGISSRSVGVSDKGSDELLSIFLNSDAARDNLTSDGVWIGDDIEIYLGESFTEG